MSHFAPIPTTGEPRGPAPELTRADFAAVAEIRQADVRIHLAGSKVTLVQSRLSRRLRARGPSRFRVPAAGVVEQEYPSNALPGAILSACRTYGRER